MAPERLIGLAHVAERMHGGQWSRGYRLLCRIDWRPKGQACKLLPREEWAAERDWAAHYYRVVRRILRSGGDF